MVQPNKRVAERPLIVRKIYASQTNTYPRILPGAISSSIPITVPNNRYQPIQPQSLMAIKLDTSSTSTVLPHTSQPMVVSNVSSPQQPQQQQQVFIVLNLPYHQLPGTSTSSNDSQPNSSSSQPIAIKSMPNAKRQMPPPPVYQQQILNLPYHQTRDKPGTNQMPGLSTSQQQFWQPQQFQQQVKSQSSDVILMTGSQQLKRLLPQPTMPIKSRQAHIIGEPISVGNRDYLNQIHHIFKMNLGQNWIVSDCNNNNIQSQPETNGCEFNPEANWMFDLFSLYSKQVNKFNAEIGQLFRIPHTNVEVLIGGGEMKATNWLDVLILRSGWYTCWNYAERLKAWKNMSPEFQSINPKPSVEEFWIDAGCSLPRRQPESERNIMRREALLDIANILYQHDVVEVEVALVCAWLLFFENSVVQCDALELFPAPSFPEVDEHFKSNFETAKETMQKIMSEYHSFYFPEQRYRTISLLTSLASAIGTAGGLLSSSK